jgi:hypothetical protein
MRRLHAALAVVVLICLLLLAAEPAYATFSGRNGRVAFRRILNKAGNWAAIFQSNPDGTRELHDDGVHFDVYSMRLNGTEIRTVVRTPKPEGTASWGPRI